jgi:hypothetical protein
VITTRGKLVFVAESFSLEMARQLTSLILDAQGTGEMRMAVGRAPLAIDVPAFHPGSESLRPITADLTHFLSSCGVSKVAVDGAVRLGR